MGILFDDAVIITQAEEEGLPSVITVNCPDKTGLGCDLFRIILFFGLTVERTDISTDGKWCYIVVWVVGKPNTRWGLLKKRLMATCPPCYTASGIIFERTETRPSDVFLLKFCCHDRSGLLHDVTKVLCELELVIKRVKVSTTPDGKVMDLFFITDTRELLHTKMRKDETCDHLKSVLGDSVISCDIEMAVPEITACSQGPSIISDAITDNKFSIEMLCEQKNSAVTFKSPSITMDNLLSPSHTLVQIICEDHKGLLYDVMRTLKDYSIQLSYGKLVKKGKTQCELDLFIMQADGKKLVDSSKQHALHSRLEMELRCPLRVALKNRGPDTELLVANPVELSGLGRPLVFYDITLALKSLGKVIFLADIGRYMMGDREWEVYRILLDEGNGLSISSRAIEEMVWTTLMRWES